MLLPEVGGPCLGFGTPVEDFGACSGLAILGFSEGAGGFFLCLAGIGLDLLEVGALGVGLCRGQGGRGCLDVGLVCFARCILRRKRLLQLQDQIQMLILFAN